MADGYDLERFVAAQHSCYARVCEELRQGRKRSHWMWFIFPQLRGLGSSATAEHFGIGSLAEARAYLGHALLGPRLRECTQLIGAVRGRSAREILGTPDDLKLRSSLTLFAQASGQEELFVHVLRQLCGEPDPRTLQLLAGQAVGS